MKDTQKRWDTLTKRMVRLQIMARSLWHAEEKERALKVGETIAKIADVRLKYIPN